MGTGIEGEGLNGGEEICGLCEDMVRLLQDFYTWLSVRMGRVSCAEMREVEKGCAEKSY